jgi:predicted nucleic acid-binding protein
MCIICIEYEKGKLKPADALRNLQELKEILDKEHVREIQKKIINDAWKRSKDKSKRLFKQQGHNNGDQNK